MSELVGLKYLGVRAVKGKRFVVSYFLRGETHQSTRQRTPAAARHYYLEIKRAWAELIARK